ncbi:MAG: ABC transporter permease [Saccharofermentans sp.]|nr:ABC transporter permease [Saccharofermentans sp.]
MFKYQLLKNIRNAGFLFWSLIFPLALMTAMYLSFGGVYNMMNSIDPIKAVVVTEDEGEFATGFQELVRSMADKDADEYYFDLSGNMNLEQAEESIKSGENKVLFVVKDNDIEIYLSNDHTSSAAIVSKAVADSYKNKYEIIREALSRDPKAAMAILEEASDIREYTQPNKGVFSGDPNMYSWYFYSSLVMGIFFNANGGTAIVSELKADVSCEAMRLSASPAKKGKLIVSSFLAYLVIAVVINMIQLVVMRNVFNISLGNDILKLILFVVAANIFSISFGIICGIIFRGTRDNRANKTTAVIMLSVFLSGEMINTLPGNFERICPIVNDINPATIMNMAFYRMALYNADLDFYTNMAKIAAVSLIFIIISAIILRREKYASL